jgi:hypothetical protein
MLTCMPTRLCPAAVSHLANATPCLESAPHNRELCCCHPMHVTGPPWDEPVQVTAVRFRAQSAASDHRKQQSIPILLPR